MRIKFDCHCQPKIEGLQQLEKERATIFWWGGRGWGEGGVGSALGLRFSLVWEKEDEVEVGKQGSSLKIKIFSICELSKTSGVLIQNFPYAFVEAKNASNLAYQIPIKYDVHRRGNKAQNTKVNIENYKVVVIIFSPSSLGVSEGAYHFPLPKVYFQFRISIYTVIKWLTSKNGVLVWKLPLALHRPHRRYRRELLCHLFLKKT